MDENGVEAAAYTVIGVRGAGLPVEREKLRFDLNRPFLFTLEAKDGTILFIGTVTAP